MNLNLLTIAAVAVAVSADAFLVGFSYGMKGLKVNGISTLGIGLMSGLFMAAALFIGDILSAWLGGYTARLIGGLVLLVAAARVLLTPDSGDGTADSPWPAFLSLLSNPARADRDRSGDVSGLEAVSLGIALSIDSLGVGIGVVMGTAINLWLPLAASLATLAALTGGILAGGRMRALPYGRVLQVLPAIILAILGLSRLLPVA